MTVKIRPIRPSDYWPVISVIDDWWNGRRMADKLPRLFFEHFTDTCFAAERDGELAGFLVGFTSQSRPGEAYIHFVGVHPGERGRGLGRRPYEHFFVAVRARGWQVVRAITAPVNRGSARFHQRMGFDIEPGDTKTGDVPVTAGYDGDGQDRVRFVKSLAADGTPRQSPPAFADVPIAHGRRRQPGP
jgi:GNAT superfamily N-acetyltransferase